MNVVIRGIPGASATLPGFLPLGQRHPNFRNIPYDPQQPQAQPEPEPVDVPAGDLPPQPEPESEPVPVDVPAGGLPPQLSQGADILASLNTHILAFRGDETRAQDEIQHTERRLDEFYFVLPHIARLYRLDDHEDIQEDDGEF